MTEVDGEMTDVEGESEVLPETDVDGLSEIEPPPAT